MYLQGETAHMLLSIAGAWPPVREGEGEAVAAVARAPGHLAPTEPQQGHLGTREETRVLLDLG